MNNLQQTQVSLTTNTITVIFKDGTTGTFEHALQWNKNIDYYDIFFMVDNKLLYAKYDVSEVSTIILGYVDIAI